MMKYTVSAAFLLALVCQSSMAAGISYHPIDGDATADISASSTYTHAVDFGSGTPRALINGVQFQAGGTTAFGAIAGTAATIGTGSTTIPTAHAGNAYAAPFLDGAAAADMEDLVEDFQYGDASGEITLIGLTPGKPYRFRLYNRPYGATPANRPQTIGFDTDGVGSDIGSAEHTAVFNADDATAPDPGFDTFSQVYALTCNYTLAAGVTSLKVYINASIGGNTYHMYGLTNEEAGPDTNAPVISAVSPIDDATGVYPGSDLTATFNEGIALTGTGTVLITDLDDGSSNVAIPLPDIRVTATGEVVTIDLSTDLEFDTSYAVQLSTNAIQDLATNAFAGITHNTNWNFTTVAQDLTAPVITNTVPADDATGVAPDATLTATFDEIILIGSGNITIYNVTDTTNRVVIPVTNASQVSISANVLTIEPGVFLEGAKEFAVQIDAGAVKNFSNLDFAGISDSTTWSFTVASLTTYIGATGQHDRDTWNNAANWDNGVPSGPLDAIIDADEYASVTKSKSGVDTPAYTGDLTLSSNATLEIASGSVDGDLNALGGGTITMHSGAIIAFRRNADTSHDQDIVMAGDARIDLCRSTSAHQRKRTFNGTISGSARLSILGVSRNWGIFTAASPAWSGGLRAFNGTSQVKGAAPGCFGTGDVTIDNSMSLQLDATNTIDNGATLHLNGNRGQIANKLILNADDTIGALNVDGFPYAGATYGRVGGPATVDVEVAWISGDGVLTVLSDPGDAHDPTTVAITDNSVNGEVFLSLQPTLTYTLTFNEPVTTSATTSDFANASDAAVTIDSITQTTDTKVQVVVTAVGSGTVALQLQGSAVFEDLFGNPMSVPVTDDSTVLVRELNLTNQIGVLDLTRNNGVNPATGNLWQEGDMYRFAFCTSTGIVATSTNISTYNDFVQDLADASPLGIGAAQDVTWKAIASTASIAARDNASLPPTGTNVSVWLVDGTTLVADDYVDLYGHRMMNHAINKSETGGAPFEDVAQYSNVWTGSGVTGGIQSGNELGAADGTSQCGLITNGDRHWITRFTLSQTGVRPLYGFSEVLTIETLPGPPGTLLIVR
jgi:hypothetical protein